MDQMLADTPGLEQPDAATFRRARPSKLPPRIGVWGHCHGGNLGDELVLATLIANVRARVPNAEILGFCVNPVDTGQRYGIPAFPIYQRGERIDKATEGWAPGRQINENPEAGPSGRMRTFIKRRLWLILPLRGARRAYAAVMSWARKVRDTVTCPLREVRFLIRCHRALRGTDILIVAGSGPLSDDWAGAWAHPYALYKWAGLARLTGSRFVCLSTGAGPLSGALSRFFVRRTIRGSWYRSYRDPSSAKLMASLGVPGAHPVYPDMGFALDAARFARRQPLPEAAKGRTVVGLNLIAHCDPRYTPRGDPQRYARYTRAVAEFAAWLLREDYAVVLLYSQIQADPRVGADVREILQREYGMGSDPRLIEQPISGFACLINWLSWCDCVVAARYHCIVLPCALNIPVIGLAYHQKTFDLMESMGQSAYCLDIDSFRATELIDLFHTLQRNRQAISTELRERAIECRARLAEQFDRVLGGAIEPEHPRAPLEPAPRAGGRTSWT